MHLRDKAKRTLDAPERQGWEDPNDADKWRQWPTMGIKLAQEGSGTLKDVIHQRKRRSIQSLDDSIKFCLPFSTELQLTYKPTEF